MQEVQREQLVKTLEDLKSKGYEYLKKITAVDYSSYIEVVYIIYNTSSKADEIVKVKITYNDLHINTVIGIFKAADWYERELAEMFGIEIIGRSTPRLLLEEWDGAEFPLLKSFTWGKDYKRRD